jgi:hypothetical protein
MNVISAGTIFAVVLSAGILVLLEISDFTQIDNIVNVQYRAERKSPHAERSPHDSRETETQA